MSRNGLFVKGGRTAWCRLLMVGVVAMVMMTGCKTREVVVTVPEYHTDTLYQSKVEKDSIWMKDSVLVREKGDTVLVDRWHVSYKEKVLVDTVYEHKVDTLTKVVEVPTGKPSGTRTWWEKLRMRVGDVLLVVLVCIVIFFIIKHFIFKVVRP